MMERPFTPPPQTSEAGAGAPPPSPPTPEVTRRIEESRLRAKALRAQREAEQRASGTAPSQPRTSSGLINTDSIHIAGTKRAHSAISRATTGEVPETNRDARSNDKKDDNAPLRPARSFAKYVDYNFEAATDTKGGFLSTEDDPWSRAMGMPGRDKQGKDHGQGPEKPANMTAAEWERLQLLRNLQRQKAGPYEPGLSAMTEEREKRKCRECGSVEIDFVWDEVFQCRVCNACKEKFPDKYSLLTKTEAREDYLLTEPELKDEDLLKHLTKPNPHKSHWHDMWLFLRYQVEEYAFSAQKWGSAEALDAEFARRQGEKKKRKEAKFKEKLTELKKKTMTDAYRRNRGQLGGTKSQFGEALGRGGANGKHTHEWGQTVENEEGMTVKTCLSCGMEIEELEF